MAVSPLNARSLAFSAQTCLDLLEQDKLGSKEIYREAKLILNANVPQDVTAPLRRSDRKLSTGSKIQTKNPSTPKKRLDPAETFRVRLIDHFKCLVDSETPALYQSALTTEALETLTHSLSREIAGSAEKMRIVTEEADKLSESIAAAKDVLSQLTTQRNAATPAPPLLLLNDQVPELSDPDTGMDPFEKSDGVPFEHLDYAALRDCLVFKKTFLSSSRQAVYFGDLPYKYPGGYHEPNPFDGCPKLCEIADKVREIYPDIKFNSALVTDYPKRGSYIPPHSDDEDAIEPDSVILTVSVGGERVVKFREKPPSTRNGELREHLLTVRHGEVYTMTRKSQDLWDHAVPKPSLDHPEADKPRISITFRQIREISRDGPKRTRRSSLPHTSSLKSTPVTRPKRVLILSDSRNMSFDCSLLRDPVKVFRKNLFYLRDIAEHSLAIQQSDLVLISSGINDIRHNKASPRQIHDSLQSFTSRFSAQFLFDSVCPMSIYADPTNAINNRVNSLNELLILLSIHSNNFKLFDNVNFGLAHLARDGLHLTYGGQDVFSRCWVEVILIHLGFKNKPLPLRLDFVAIVCGYRNNAR